MLCLVDFVRPITQNPTPPKSWGVPTSALWLGYTGAFGFAGRGLPENPPYILPAMQAFAALLDRLVLTPARNGKLRLLTDYFRAAPIPTAAMRSRR